MKILTNKKLDKCLEEKFEQGWQAGNRDATKAWKNEFTIQEDQNKKNKNEMLDLLEKIVLDYNEIINIKNKKQFIVEKFQDEQNDLLDTIKLLRGN